MLLPAAPGIAASYWDQNPRRPEIPPFPQLPPGVGPAQNSWRALDPLTLLAILAKHPGETIHIRRPPQGWIKREEVWRLRDLIDSQTPAASICDNASPLKSKAPSTVGKEAERLLRVTQSLSDDGWPGTCSDLDTG